ncbi:multidrug ABC transporter ATP-binding protein [Anoxybacter fermentans]|uniref:Multidrug ABC transporter ATP-binding protein n=1 Tax=Anoxybacter fermentans TaxID=1323375 RepID=A0A3S9SV29_9FIRM|nr:ABC transporter ATP-binding protein [Anoxybacter fermentans]AZR72138.1 multidrug ABC transporter ATP-binding protein [Anoxybacter fermentans]
MRSFKTLWPFIKEHKWMYILGIIWVAFTDALQLITPQLLRTITDRFQEGNLTLKELLYYTVLIIAIALGIAIFRFLWRWFVIGTSRKMEYYLRNKFFAHLQKLSTNFFNHHKTGDLMAHATNDINSVRMAMGPGIVFAFDGFFLTLTTLAILLSINVRLTLISLIPLPFLAIIVTSFGQVIHKRFLNVQDAFSKLTDKVQENFAGIRVVKSFVQEKFEIDKFTEANQLNMNANMHLVRIWGMFHPLIEVFATLSFVIILGYGGRLVMLGEISLGDFVAFYTYLGLMTWPIIAIGWVINIFQRGSASMKRINAILHEKPEIYNYPDTRYEHTIKGKIEFKNLTFRYSKDTPPVLKNINLTIKEGQTLAIVGRTGSGKTTLVNLLLRLFNPERGQIFIDGVDINQIPLETLRQNIGYVPQDNFLFSTTIAENINFAFEKLDMPKIEEAAKIAQVYENIMDFPKKFETMVGERGVTLSGGQKQRISIARAIIKNPKILILDDCLSAVDTQTEEKILKELRKIMKDRTSIIISHRISSIKDADHIIVLEKGEIIEEGTHEELLKANGLYSYLYEKQLLEENLESA